MGIGTKQKIWKRVKSAIQATLMMSVYAMPLMMPVKAQMVGLSNTQFATKAQLQSDFDLNGKTEAHILFGNRPYNEKYYTESSVINDYYPSVEVPAGNVDWYIVGQDGNGYIVLYNSDVLIGSNHANYYETYSFSNAPEPSEGHYGTKFASSYNIRDYSESILKDTLDDVSEDERYFTEIEQNLMSETTFNTLMLNVNNITQKLYPAGATEQGSDVIFVGHDDHLVIPLSKIFSNHWLRSSHRNYQADATHGSGHVVNGGKTDKDDKAIACACKLDLSTVNFASSATATLSGSSAQNTSSGTLSQITGEPAMRLRTSGLESSAPTVDGSTVKFTAPSTERLMVQLNAGGNDYQCYFAGTGSEETVNLATIAANSGIDTTNTLIDGKVWVETDVAGTGNRILQSTAAQTVRFGATDLIDQSMHGVYARVAQNSTDTFDMTVDWKAQTFVYEKGYWNGKERVRATDVPGVEAGATEGATGKWYGHDGTNNKVTITNNSNVNVKVSAVATTKTPQENPHIGTTSLSIAGASGESWTTNGSAQEKVLSAHAENGSADTKNLLLNVTGTPDDYLTQSSVSPEILGTITITFTKSSS